MKSLHFIFFSLLSGCGSVQYIVQAGMGQLEMSNRARPITDVLHDQRTSQLERRYLELTPKVKAYAAEIGLKQTSNYHNYVKLDRDAVSYVVSASRPLEFKPKVWSFPIVGSFNYLGFFDHQMAKEYLEELKKDGWDASVRGASAYSTLGWFDDPVVSTMFRESKAGIGVFSDVLIHEIVHETVYIKGQSYFNESLASFVADTAVLKFLEKEFSSDSQILKEYLDYEARSEEIAKAYKKAFSDLKALYDSSSPDAEKIQKKEEIIRKLRTDYKIEREINNATLIQFQTYGVGEAEFRELYLKTGSSWPRFLERIKSIQANQFSKEQDEDFGRNVLQPLIQRLD